MADDFHPKARGIWLPLGLIALAAGLAYANTFNVPFLFDDEGQIVSNIYVRQLFSPRVLSDTTRPVTRLTYAVNYALHGLDVHGYHAVNLALHILAAWALFGLVRRTLWCEGIPDRLRQRATPLAFVIALFWAVHPLTTSAVTYLSQRAEVLMAACYLGCLYAVNRGAHSPSRSRWWYLTAVVLCLVGMGSKEVIVTAPVLVLIYDRVFLAGSWRRAISQRRGLYAGLALSWVLLPVLWWWAPKLFETVGTVAAVSPWQYLASQPTVILHYLKLAVWPDPLVFDYAWAPIVDGKQILLTSTIVLIALLTTGFAAFRWPRATFALAAFWIVLAPTSSFVPVQDLIFEHRMYLPLAALVTVAVLLGMWLLDRLFAARARVVGGVLAAGLVLALGVRTWLRNSDYESAVSIWTQTVTDNETNFRAQTNLAKALSSTYPEDLDRALVHGKLAVEYARERNARYAPASNILGTIYDLRLEFQNALSCFAQAVQFAPNDAASQNNYGHVLLKLGAVQSALPHFAKAVELEPNLADTHYNYGLALMVAGDPQQAIHEYREAERLCDQGLLKEALQAHLYCNLGYVLLTTSKVDEAEQYLQRALAIRPEYPQALYSMGLLKIAFRNQREEGIALLKKSIECNPEYYEAYQKLVGIYLQRNQLEQAIKQMQGLIAKNPFHTRGLTDLGVLYTFADKPHQAIDAFQRAMKSDPREMEARIALAWLWSTHPDPAIRAGNRAVRILEPFCLKPQVLPPVIWQKYAAQAWSTLAAAYAECGKFDRAVEASDKAIELATDEELLHDLEVRRQLYQTGLPYREPRQVATHSSS